MPNPDGISGGNSFKSKAIGKNKIISGQARTKGKRNSKSSFLSSGTTAAGIGKYILQSIIEPAIKKLIYDICTNGLSMSLWGDTRGAKGLNDRYGYSSSNISYINYYKDGSDFYRTDPRYSGNRIGFNYKDVIVPTQGDAELILNKLNEDIEAYGITTVLKLYDYAGLQTFYTDNNYGWNDIRSAEVIRDGNGWRIKMPRPEFIKNL